MACERRKGVLGRVKRSLGRALADYQMTADGDTLLVALSGGKDSSALLHILQTRRQWIPIDYDLVPVHVALGENEDQCRIERLYEQTAALGLKLKVLDSDIALRLEHQELPESPCFHCSRWKRKLLFDYAAEKNIAKIAFGHHRDDILETALLNLFYGSSFSAMRPHQILFSGRLTIIRPLAYLDEKDVISYCRHFTLPVDSPPCRFQKKNGRREAMKNLLLNLEKDNSKVKTSLFHALRNVRHEYLL